MRARTIAYYAEITALFACGSAGDAFADAHGLWLT